MVESSFQPVDGRFRGFLRRKGASLMLFGYGAAAGTAGPLLLARCGGGACTACGACGLGIGLGIVPLLVYFLFRGGAFRSLRRRLAARSARRASS